jgi:hypothetical protein
MRRKGGEKNARIKMHTCVFKGGGNAVRRRQKKRGCIMRRQPDRDQVAYYKNRRQKTADATESRAIKRDNEPKTMDETLPVEAEIQSLSVSFIHTRRRDTRSSEDAHMSRLGAEKEAEMPIASA